MSKLWKPVLSVWVGGTLELLRFRDARVRVLRTCSGILNDPVKSGHPTQISLPAGRMGVLTEAKMGDIFVGFANDASVLVTTGAALLRTPKGVFGVRLNWATFKTQFEIEI